VLIVKGRNFTWVNNITCFSQVNQAYVVTILGLISSADNTTCNLFAVAAVTFIISLSATTSGADNNSDVPLAEIDLITAVVADGTVYKVVALVLVKSTFLFTNVLAIK
jgi:hypothetical protein